MTILVDAAPIVAAADRRDKMQSTVTEILLHEPGPLVLPAPVTAEIDHLLTARIGEHARQLFLDDLAAERFDVECLTADEYAVVADLERRYSDLAPGLADLSIVVLARRLGTRRILTFDQKHFRAFRPLDGGTFTLVPGDSHHA